MYSNPASMSCLSSSLHASQKMYIFKKLWVYVLCLTKAGYMGSIEETLKKIEKKLEMLESEIKEIRKEMREDDIASIKSLVELPDHLRKTAKGLRKIGQGTASDVSKYTGRARAVESGYLNQLERQGYVTSFRKSRQKIFSMGTDFKNQPGN